MVPYLHLFSVALRIFLPYTGKLALTPVRNDVVIQNAGVSNSLGLTLEFHPKPLAFRDLNKVISVHFFGYDNRKTEKLKSITTEITFLLFENSSIKGSGPTLYFYMILIFYKIICVHRWWYIKVNKSKTTEST